MPIIGIDLGASNSAAAVLRGGRPTVIPSAQGITLGGKAFPSYVALTADGQIIVGEPARRQATVNPEGTTTAFKRLMGRREKVGLRKCEFSPEELSGFLLQKIKRAAEALLGEQVNQAVITVPAFFNDDQRNATKDAARIAGLEVMRLVNEPTAAALAYGLDRLGQELRIAVVDFGGGTLDVTIMEFGKGVFEVKATSGNTRHAGTDMDKLVFECLADRFQVQTVLTSETVWRRRGSRKRVKSPTSNYPPIRRPISPCPSLRRNSLARAPRDFDTKERHSAGLGRAVNRSLCVGDQLDAGAPALRDNRCR